MSTNTGRSRFVGISHPLAGVILLSLLPAAPFIYSYEAIKYFFVIIISVRIYTSRSESITHGHPGTYWLNFVLPAKKARHAIEGLDDLYDEFWLPRYGPVRAKWIYRAQTVWTVGEVWASPICNLISRIAHGLSIG
jgi:hypothetical protein